MTSDAIFVRHMLDAIDELEKILGSVTYIEFINEPMRIHAAVRLFEILGEAAGKLSLDFRKQYSDIPYSDIIGMRNKLIHHYFEVDLETLWEAYKEDVPELKKILQKAL